MIKAFGIPPRSKDLPTSPEVIGELLRVLIGRPFMLTRKPRTDGSNIRKADAKALERYPLPEPCPPNEIQIIPPTQKGGPKIRLEYLDTYLVATGTYYNLQVWNRNPAEDSIQVEYKESEPLSSKDVRFVFVRVDPDEHFAFSAKT